jgi:hypothetical protein
VDTTRRRDMSKSTIVTSSGNEVTGEVVSRDGEFKSLAEGLICIATLGLSELGSQPSTTVRDERGNHWTGREK